MCVNGPVLCSVVVVLLLVSVSQSSSKSTCNYSEIVHTYKEVILVDLKNLNMTTTFNPTKEKGRCPSEKQLKVVGSIYGMTQTFLSLDSQDGMGKPVEMMAQLITQSCTHITSGAEAQGKEEKRPRGRKRRRIKLISALMNCWEKLLSMYTPEE